MRYTTFLFLTCVLFFVSCEQQDEDPPIIPEDRFTEFYIKLAVLQERATLMAVTPEQTESMKDSLYEAEGVTETEVQQTVDYYKKDIGRWKRFHENVTQRLEDLHRDAVNTKQNKSSH